MRNAVMIALSSVLLTACSSGKYVTDISSESYQEDYTTDPAVGSVKYTTKRGSNLNLVEKAEIQAITVVADPQVTSTTKPAMKMYSGNKMIKVLPVPHDEQQKTKHDDYPFGYTIQIAAVSSAQKAEMLADRLPNGHSAWKHHKQVNGTDWYAVLYGDYETKSKAKSVISTLPKYFQDLKPFVKSVDQIKKSKYSTLVQLK